MMFMPRKEGFRLLPFRVDPQGCAIRSRPIGEGGAWRSTQFPMAQVPGQEAFTVYLDMDGFLVQLSLPGYCENTVKGAIVATFWRCAVREV